MAPHLQKGSPPPLQYFVQPAWIFRTCYTSPWCLCNSTTECHFPGASRSLPHTQISGSHISILWNFVFMEYFSPLLHSYGIFHSPCPKWTYTGHWYLANSTTKCQLPGASRCLPHGHHITPSNQVSAFPLAPNSNLRKSLTLHIPNEVLSLVFSLPILPLSRTWEDIEQSKIGCAWHLRSMYCLCFPL